MLLMFLSKIFLLGGKARTRSSGSLFMGNLCFKTDLLQSNLFSCLHHCSDRGIFSNILVYNRGDRNLNFFTLTPLLFRKV